MVAVGVKLPQRPGQVAQEAVGLAQILPVSPRVKQALLIPAVVVGVARVRFLEQPLAWAAPAS